MNDRRLGALPLGELHDAGICARCGRHGEVEHEGRKTRGEPLMSTTMIETHARAMVCKDTHACLRRRTNKKKARS